MEIRKEREREISKYIERREIQRELVYTRGPRFGCQGRFVISSPSDSRPWISDRYPGQQSIVYLERLWPSVNRVSATNLLCTLYSKVECVIDTTIYIYRECLLFTVYCTVYNVNCTMYAVYYTVYDLSDIDISKNYFKESSDISRYLINSTLKLLHRILMC